MDKIIVKSKAKVNLSLDILGLREDGYHEVKMIIQTIPLYDLMTIEREKSNHPEIEISSSLKSLVVDERNHAYKACKKIMEEAGIKDKIKIHIRKTIPMGGGVGGSSANAATVFTAINKLYKLGYSKEELSQMSRPIGSDVAAQIYGGCVLAEGRGTDLRPITPLRGVFMLLVNPQVYTSTRKVYSDFDKMLIPEDAHPNIDEIIELIRTRQIKEFARKMKNVLEIPVFENKEKIKILKDEMKKPALGAMMTGSGSSVFSLYEDESLASKMSNYYRQKGFFAILMKL